MNLTGAIRRLRPKRPRPPRGTPAGTIRGVQSPTQTAVDVLAYGSAGGGANYVELANPDVAKIQELLSSYKVVWVNITGLTDVERLRRIGGLFNLHPLALEDCTNLYQRPKIEDYGHYYYIVMRMPDVHRKDTELEQFSLFFGKGFVLSIQEHSGDCFDPIRARIRGGKTSLMEHGSDYLASAMLDAVIDDFFPHIERIADKLETLETEIMTRGQKENVQIIYAMRQELLLIRRAIWPLRDALAIMYREQSPLVEANTRFYFRDCYDHTVQIIDALESYRDLVSSMMEIYLSSISYRLNDIMRTLTVISTLFMPLNLIAGIYGMNFHPDASPWNMPELSWYYGYPFALGLMGLLVLVLLTLFRWRGWLKT
ncbi:magnesium and cobalt transport protein CorA [bacterium]|nr:magnesium and cobalt transport protein CorA [bacterium]